MLCKERVVGVVLDEEHDDEIGQGKMDQKESCGNINALRPCAGENGIKRVHDSSKGKRKL